MSAEIRARGAVTFREGPKAGEVWYVVYIRGDGTAELARYPRLGDAELTEAPAADLLWLETEPGGEANALLTATALVASDIRAGRASAAVLSARVLLAMVERWAHDVAQREMRR